MSNETKELLSAEVFLDSFGPKVNTDDIDAELEHINQKLQAYQCQAGIEDYAIAVLSGILAGAIDAFVIKQTDITEANITAAPGQLLSCLRQATGSGPITKAVIRHAPIDKGIINALPELEGLTLNTTTIGLVATLLCQFSNSGMLRYDGEKLHLLPKEISKKEGIWLSGIAVVAALMKWLYNAADQEDAPVGSFKTVARLRQVMHVNPMMADIVRCIDKWQTQLPGEMKLHRETTQKDMSIDGIFLSLLNALSAIPAMKGSKLADTVEKYRHAERMGITAIPLAGALIQQAIPVMLIEILVKATYFATRLSRELAAHEDVTDIEWDNVVSFDNRTIARMIAIATLTFTTADIADAAVHAVVESEGNGVLFGMVFLKRVNIVGVGRATVAIYKDISAEREEAALLQQRRKLMEAKAERFTAQLGVYRQQLEERVCEYIAEDICAFLTGFDFMDRGLVAGDSDLVIKGNVVIQRVLGREPQFTNQQEFDDLMNSDIPLKL